MKIRKARALVIPLKFREGYPDRFVGPLINQAAALIAEADIDVTLTQPVTYDADADAVAHEYSPGSFDFAVLLVPTWFEPATMVRAAKNYFSLPFIVWGFSNFTDEGKRVNLGSSAGAGVTKGTLREYGVKHRYIYHSPAAGFDEEIKHTLKVFAAAARAVALLKGSRILTIGYQFGGMTIGDMDLTKMCRVFGVDLEERDAYQLISAMEALDVDSAEFKADCEKVNSLTGGTIGRKLERVTRMYTALKNMVGEVNAQAVTLKCHFAFSQEYGLTPCIPLSVIGNEVVASCEADIPLTLTQLALTYLEGGEPSTYADTHELTGKRILWGACGFAPGNICVDNKIICELPPENPTGLGATFKDYITNRNWLKAGPLTVARILKDPDGGFTLHTAAAKAVGNCGDACEYGMPQYSFTETELECDFDAFAQHTGSHHYALCYAKLKEEIALLCEFLGIRLLQE